MRQRKKKQKALWTTLPGWENLKGSTNVIERQKKAVYTAAAKKFVEDRRRWGLTCVVVNTIPELHNGKKYGHPISNKLNEVHHIRGRRGRLLLDQRYWMAVSKQGHRWIHAHPEEARKRGWYAPIGKWEVAD